MYQMFEERLVSMYRQKAKFVSFEWKRLNPFSTNVLLLYALKTSENRRFSDAFRGYRSGALVENGLRTINYAVKKIKVREKIRNIKHR